MAISEIITASETVGATEHSIVTDTGGPDTSATDGVIQGWIDFNALAAGDTYRVRVYEMAASAGTQRIVYEAFIQGAQSQPMFVLPSLVMMHGWDITVTKTGGTDRSIVWSVRSVA